MQVFLSYAWSAADSFVARKLAGALRAAKMTVWLDEEQLPAGGHRGDRLDDRLRQGIDASDAAVFLVSQSWIERDWTRWELDLFAARNPRPRLVPLLRLARDQLLRYIPPQLSQLAQLEWLDSEKSPIERFWQVYCGVQDLPPGPREEWQARGLAISGSVFNDTQPGSPGEDSAPSTPRPALPRKIWDDVSTTCDRARHWTAFLTHARTDAHEMLLLPGARGSGHKQFLARVMRDLSEEPPRAIAQVTWPERPRTQADYLELLATGLGEPPGGRVDLEARVIDLLRARLASRNLVLLQSPLRSGFDDPEAMRYYTVTLPALLAKANPAHRLKYVQPIEWSAEGIVTKIFQRLRGGGLSSDHAGAHRLMEALEAKAGAPLRIKSLPPLAEIPRDELIEFLDALGLTAVQRDRLMKQIDAVAHTPEEVFTAIEDYYPEVSRSTS